MSRHTPLPAQLNFLRRVLGNFKLIIYAQRIPNAEFAVELARKVRADIIIPVLPLSFIARLCEASKRENFEVWWAEMHLIHQCTQTPCPDYNPNTDVIMPPNRHFRFKTFKRIKEIRLVLEDIEK